MGGQVTPWMEVLFFAAISLTSYFLSALLQDYDAQDLLDFEETILRGCDFNRDGKISKKELTMILLALSKHSQEDDTKK